ncbi:hypothetical protein [Sphingomonas sp.]|uniref:hypothetical protein n=1 Tax=Sphingomonas sp. TaxID=28214 RepID=UPI002BDE082C|nr:hypothetical protein [Sphingomonas sp.]HTG37463.1 hypothetical protein [Sphingomonas sp.]
MHEPSIRTSRLAIAGGLAAAIVVGGAGFLIGRDTAPDPQPVLPRVIRMPVAVPTPAPSDTARILARADLLALATQAADAHAAGEPTPKPVQDAAGRRFELTLPFGCTGPSAPESSLPMRWRYDEEAATLRVSVTADRWQGADWNLGGDMAARPVEGFWIARPWSGAARCASGGQTTPTGREPVLLPGQTLAIARFPEGEAQDEAEPRRFEVVKRVPADQFDGSQGLRVRVIGRVAAVPGASPVRCTQPGGIDQRPICLIGARFDEVRIENPATDDVLGVWPIR